MATPGVAPGATTFVGREYEPRSPQDSVLHRVVLEHLETFLAEASARSGGTGVPKFVERAFRDLIDCGSPVRGFARLRCSQCGFERRLPFSCKKAICPSCSGRRMTELSAHLMDSVIPIVHVRQWVLTLPYQLRYHLAWNHDRCRQVLAVFMRALLGFYRRKAKALGIADGRSGAVTVIQRAGSGLDLNLHLHTLALDGMFHSDGNTKGQLNFQPLPKLADTEVARVLATVRRPVIRMLTRDDMIDEAQLGFDFDSLADTSPTLAGIYSASVQKRIALGRRAGQRVARIGAIPGAPWVASNRPLQAHLDGFDLHAAVAVDADDRSRLERLCRYVLRPPVVQDRLELLDTGEILLELKTPYHDGTTHLAFEPLEFMEKLAAIIPRPRVNQLIYHGVLGARATDRPAVVAFGRNGSANDDAPTDPPADDAAVAEPTGRKNYSWALLMARAFGLDVLECPRCSGRMALIATIEDPPVIKKILTHLGLPTSTPETSPARAPPHRWEVE